MKKDVLEMRKRIYGSDTDHPDIALSISNLAYTYGDLGQHEEAMAMKKNVLEMEKRIYGSDTDHPHIALSMNNLASTYSELGQHEKALAESLSQARWRWRGGAVRTTRPPCRRARRHTASYGYGRGQVPCTRP